MPARRFWTKEELKILQAVGKEPLSDDEKVRILCELLPFRSQNAVWSKLRELGLLSRPRINYEALERYKRMGIIKEI
jgi:hypothetical protein